MKLPDKIAGLRKSRGISQEELAERLGVSRQAVSRWETGSAKPDANNILQLSLLFHVTTDYLLHDDYQSDQDLPGIRKTNQILRTNLTLIAIIAQVSFLNGPCSPFQTWGSRPLTVSCGRFALFPCWPAHSGCASICGMSRTPHSAGRTAG